MMDWLREIYASRPAWKWWTLLAVYIALAAHTAWSMKRSGRRFWVWFVISILATPLPAAVVSFYDYFRQLRQREEPPDELPPGPRRCRHCGNLLEGNTHQAAGREVCDKCNLAVDDDLA